MAPPSVRPAYTLDRAAPVLAFVIGAAAIWLPPRPPMIDLPQFAGQIALLKGLILGTTPWAANLRVDLLTPYLVGYAVTLPLAFVLPVTAALKLVLTAALAGFGLAAAAIRKELGAARALDAYALIGFFGFDYAWGLYTFLVAAPLGLMLIWLSLRYARQPSGRGGAALAGAGIALLFAHALVMLFAVGTGGLLALARLRAWGLRRTLGRLWPYALPVVIGALVYFAKIQPHGATAGGGGGFGLDFGPLDLRLLGPLFAIDGYPAPWTVGALVALAALPFVGGLKIRARPIERLILAGAVVAALALAPAKAWVAAGLYMRFALFAPAAWAWLFDDRSPPSGLARAVGPRLALAASAIAGLILAEHLAPAMRFAPESRDFDIVMARAAPGQRALALVLDPASAADVHPQVYRHFPSWYQAERGGLVDPSFADSSPSIVRYRINPAGLSEDPAFPDRPDLFDWRRDHGDQWRYFFVRDRSPPPPTLFAGARCPPAEIAASGAWRLYESRGCGPTDR